MSNPNPNQDFWEIEQFEMFCPTGQHFLGLQLISQPGLPLGFLLLVSLEGIGKRGLPGQFPSTRF